MGSEDRTEACGRCAMSSVVDATSGDGEDPERDLFGEGRIELDEATLRRASGHVVALGRVKRRLDELATRLIYGQ